MSDVQREDAVSGPMTAEQLRDLFRQATEEEMLAHVCLVGPRGGYCLDCGQPWRVGANGRLEIVLTRDDLP